MKRILLTALLIVTANTVAATTLSIKHNKKLPTPYELITKGNILDKYKDEWDNVSYWIAWDKTDDIYFCSLNTRVEVQGNARIVHVDSDCYLSLQETKEHPKQQ